MPPQPEAPGRKIRARAKLHWNEIRNVENSVWKEFDSAVEGSDGESAGGLGRSVALDVKRFEELFCFVPGQEQNTTKKPAILQKVQFTTFLQLQRANNISIGLSRFTRRGMSTEALFKAIAEMDSDKLTPDDLITLQTLLPTPEELSVAEHYANNPPPELPLAPAEAFAVQVCKSRDLPNQLLAFLFKLQLPIEAAEVHAKLAKLASVARQFRNSERLKVLLRTVLQLGNMTNYEYGARNPSYRPWMGREARALGFKIEGLARLRDVKSADGKWSLMTFMVEMLETSRPDVLDICDEFTDVSVARNYDIPDLVTQVSAMETTARNLESIAPEDNPVFRELLAGVLESAQKHIATLKTEFVNFVTAWMDALQYFGEDMDEYIVPSLDKAGGGMPPEGSTRKGASYLFITLDLFFSGFKAAVEEVRTRREMERQRTQREAAAAEERERRAKLKADREAAEAAAAAAAAAAAEADAEAAARSPDSAQPPSLPVAEPLASIDKRAGEASEMFKRFSMMPMRPLDAAEIKRLSGIHGLAGAGDDSDGGDDGQNGVGADGMRRPGARQLAPGVGSNGDLDMDY
ncbi:hypothetical protein HK105_205871 [Polyrhizophydium stewartii]|uniref:FH2 domain-containing protein n=1 Tax=Polyrhizophydium stewartii TaxID=2732419 RepID=A0ABR4N4S4_9FUNG